LIDFDGARHGWTHIAEEVRRLAAEWAVKDFDGP